MPVLLLELNEINFDYVRAYGRLGKLPTLNDLIASHGITETTSEQSYEDLEPWIQWVTAHTGLTLAEHGVYRLGDITNHEIDQIWEVLERQGLKVGAVSPMNASNRCREPAFFIPDPWTSTPISGSGIMQRLHQSISQAVNDNAKAEVTATSALHLLAGLVRFARPQSYMGYLSDVTASLRGRPWRKAMLLDRLLSDIFVAQTKVTRPDFASLFLNAGAHIQHHYLFNSDVYGGSVKNPDWYLDAKVDPILEVYSLYDSVVADVVRSLPGYRVMLATGLHQEPHGSTTLYWRLKDHAAFLAKFDIPFERVEPRMSRDFVVFCDGEEEARIAARKLGSITSVAGAPLFEVDNRGNSLFVMLTWAEEIGSDFVCRSENGGSHLIQEYVAFVAVKNGEHSGVGYVVDTGTVARDAHVIKLSELPSIIAEACGAEWPNRADPAHVSKVMA